MNSHSSKTRAMMAVHKSLGEEYLDAMETHGLRGFPVVCWSSRLGEVGGGTRARIFWREGEDEEEVIGFPRELLASEVVRRVLARLEPGN